MRASLADSERLAELVKLVWPEHSLAELVEIINGYILSDSSAVFYERADGQTAGAALCCLRHDYVEGCDTRPVEYLEGVGVREAYRRRGIAKKLAAACEQWAREKGCSEFASGCGLTNTASLRFHLGIGFEEENRIICLRKHCKGKTNGYGKPPGPSDDRRFEFGGRERAKTAPSLLQRLDFQGNLVDKADQG
ncbi:MAG: GNAT family N-acetyltransferase [Clostridia bacterium]|nr:GNAT family N-acetyltransferase [Clostridia bacterium]